MTNRRIQSPDATGVALYQKSTGDGSDGDPFIDEVKVTGLTDLLATGTPIAGQSLEAGGAGALGWLSSIRKKLADLLGSTSDAEATGDGSVIALLKRLRTLLDGSSIATATATIANAASLSGAVALSGKGIIRIVMPGTWTAANLTFQTSADNNTYNDLYTSTGSEYTVTAAASRSIILPPADFVGINYIKVRSGTAAAAVNQGGSRDIILIVRAF